VEEGEAGERCLRRVPEEERYERWHLQQEVEPFLCICNASASGHEVVQGFEGQVWSRWSGLLDSVPEPILRREGAN
jgi:hypothetical protein